MNSNDTKEMDMQKFHTKETWALLTVEEKHAVERRTLHAHLKSFGIDAARGLLAAVEAGEIDGMRYEGDDGCGCILGTLVKTRNDGVMPGGWYDNRNELADEDVVTVTAAVFEEVAHPDDEDEDCNDAKPAYTVAEILAINIEPGDTPENNEAARLVAEWTREWIEENA